jgi:septal ring factor EnvC (AmiA/AmiB activator)
MAEVLETPAKQALRELRYFANSLRGLLALDERLGKLGDLEQAIVASKKEIEKQKAEFEKLKDEEKRLTPIVQKLVADEARLSPAVSRLSDELAKMRAKLEGIV